MWDLVKGLFVPGSPPFLLLALVVGLVLLRRRSTRRLALAWIAALVTLYLVLSLPFTAQLLAKTLQDSYRPLPESTRLAHPFAIVAFQGDHGEGRVREAARLYRGMSADWVVVSGDDEMYWAIVSHGVPRDRIVREARSTNTREQAVNLEPILRRRAIERFVLVCSSIHMRRALAAVQSAGLRPIPSVSEISSRPPASGLGQLVPAYRALRLSEACLYEFGALALYSTRGWLRGN